MAHNVPCQGMLPGTWQRQRVLVFIRLKTHVAILEIHGLKVIYLYVRICKNNSLD